MKKLRPVALLCAGPVSRSPLTRLPNLRRHLVWVKSSSYRVASRAVNALGAGTPVEGLEDMKRAGIWVISVPVSELAALEISRMREWYRRTLMILHEAESDVGIGFRGQGSHGSDVRAG